MNFDEFYFGLCRENAENVNAAYMMSTRDFCEKAFKAGAVSRASGLEVQERRLLWLIERSATVDKFQEKYRVASQNEIMSEWHDDPLAAIDEAIGNDPS